MMSRPRRSVASFCCAGVSFVQLRPNARCTIAATPNVSLILSRSSGRRAVIASGVWPRARSITPLIVARSAGAGSCVGAAAAAARTTLKRPSVVAAMIREMKREIFMAAGRRLFLIDRSEGKACDEIFQIDGRFGIDDHRSGLEGRARRTGFERDEFLAEKAGGTDRGAGVVIEFQP